MFLALPCLNVEMPALVKRFGRIFGYKPHHVLKRLLETVEIFAVQIDFVLFERGGSLLSHTLLAFRNSQIILIVTRCFHVEKLGPFTGFHRL